MFRGHVQVPSLPLGIEMYIEPAVPMAAGPLSQEEDRHTVEKPPPLAGPNVMNVVMVGAECAPWSKTGAFRANPTVIRTVQGKTPISSSPEA